MAFVGSYGDTGLRTADVDPATGALTITGEFAVPDVSWLTSHDGRLYATNERTAGSITVLDKQTLTPLRSLDSRGDDPTYVSVHPDGSVLVANYSTGFAVLSPDGTADVFRGVHAHQVLPDPSGRWVVGVDLGTDFVTVYRLVDGQLRHHRSVAAGPGPRHLVWHGDRAYVACENAPVVLACSWDVDAGRLAVLEFHETAEAVNYPGEIVLSADGRFLYVTNRGSNTIATFAVGDSLTRLPDVPSGGDWPRHAVLDPTGRWLYVANQRSGTVTWLPRDPETGVLSPAVGETAVADVAMVFLG